jgi:nicotinate-nucleotide adenylyltransferase
MNAGRRVGVFGGAFDPPHRGHRTLAEVALHELALDELRIIPTGQAWHKARPLTDAAHRLAMCRLAFADLPRIVLDEREIRRPGPSYTLDTLRELQAEQPQAELYLVMGQDQAEALPTWRNWERIVELAIICVADRDGLSGQATRFVPPPALAARFRTLPMPAMPISATAVRAQVAAGQGAGALVSPAVARYIEDHHLYQGH